MARSALGWRPSAHRAPRWGSSVLPLGFDSGSEERCTRGSTGLVRSAATRWRPALVGASSTVTATEQRCITAAQRMRELTASTAASLSCRCCALGCSCCSSEQCGCLLPRVWPGARLRCCACVRLAIQACRSGDGSSLLTRPWSRAVPGAHPARLYIAPLLGAASAGTASLADSARSSARYRRRSPRLRWCRLDANGMQCGLGGRALGSSLGLVCPCPRTRVRE